MATLPDFTAFGERPAPQPSGAVVGYRPVGSQVGDALSGAGREIQQAATYVGEANYRQDAIAAESAMNVLRQKAAELEFNVNDGFRNVKGGGAIKEDFRTAYTGRFADAVNGISDSLQNDQQKAMFKQRIPVAALQYQSALLQHQAQQTEVFNDQVDNDKVNIALSAAARKPNDELGFQTELLNIGSAIDARAKRQNLPPETVQVLKAKFEDAAYSTRIMSVLRGIPGVQEPDPYAAERMFEQVRDKLGPASQLSLAHEVLQGSRTLEQYNFAKRVYGNQPTVSPNDLAPAVSGSKPLAAVVQEMESGGRRYDKNGQLLTSAAGAQGEMQVMPSTAAAPGFGIAPAKDGSPDELARVGKDYLGAMTSRYQDPALILAAYNAGPGQVDKWLATYGDPRTGQISPTDWAAKIPIKETREYVTTGMQKAGYTNASGTPIAAPTKRELRTQVGPMMDDARDGWLAMHPNDVQGAEAVAARIGAWANKDLQQVQAQQGAAYDTAMRLIVGGATTVDDVLKDPAGRAAWGQMTPEAQMAVQQRLAKGARGWDESAFKIFAGLKGLSTTDPEAFQRADLPSFTGTMPDAAVKELIELKSSMNAKDAKEQSRQVNLQTLHGAVSRMWEPIVAGMSKTKKAELDQQFYGRLDMEIEQFHADPANSGKWPDPFAVQKMASGLLAQGAVHKDWLFGWGPTSSTRAFQTENDAGWFVPLPDAKSKEMASLVASFQRKYGRVPQGSELQDELTRAVRAGGKVPWKQ